MLPENVEIQTIVSQPFVENTYLAQMGGQDGCLVVDPGLEPEAVISAIEQVGWQPAAILLTHGHADHIAGVPALKQRWPQLPVIIGRGDADKLADAWKNLSAPFGLEVTIPPADQLVDDGQRLTLAGFELEVRLIPGHSTGHVVFVADTLRPMLVFGGDVLFAGSVGRTDFPDGSFEQLADGIHRRLFDLPDDTVVLSGHGPATTIGRERRTNPFVGQD